MARMRAGERRHVRRRVCASAGSAHGTSRGSSRLGRSRAQRRPVGARRELDCRCGPVPDGVVHTARGPAPRAGSRRVHRCVDLVGPTRRSRAWQHSVEVIEMLRRGCDRSLPTAVSAGMAQGTPPSCRGGSTPTGIRSLHSLGPWSRWPGTQATIGAPGGPLTGRAAVPVLGFSPCAGHVDLTARQSPGGETSWVLPIVCSERCGRGGAGCRQDRPRLDSSSSWRWWPPA